MSSSGMSNADQQRRRSVSVALLRDATILSGARRSRDFTSCLPDGGQKRLPTVMAAKLGAEDQPIHRPVGAATAKDQLRQAVRTFHGGASSSSIKEKRCRQWCRLNKSQRSAPGDSGGIGGSMPLTASGRKQERHPPVARQPRVRQVNVIVKVAETQRQMLPNRLSCRSRAALVLPANQVAIEVVDFHPGIDHQSLGIHAG